MSFAGENELLVLLGVISAIFAVTFFFFVRSLMESRERRLSARLTEAGDLPLERLEIQNEQQSMKPLGDFVTRTGLNLDAEQALGWMTLTGVVVASLLYVIQPEWWVGVAGLAIGAAAVWLTFVFFRFRYRLKLQDQLPDMIFLTARSLRAGLSLEQALTLVGNQGVEPLASEIRRANSQIKLGLTIPLSLEITAKRLNLPDFNSLVSTVGMYSVTGGNLPLMLDRLANSVREQNQFRAFFRSATAMGRLSSIFIGGAAPTFFLVYLMMDSENAAFFFNSQVGITTLILVAVLEFIGIVWLWSIIKLDY